MKNLTDKVAAVTGAAIISGIKKNRRHILIGRDAKALDLLTRLFPKSMVYLCRRYLPAHGGKICREKGVTTA